jgi:hypothetical protein
MRRVQAPSRGGVELPINHLAAEACCDRAHGRDDRAGGVCSRPASASVKATAQAGHVGAATSGARLRCEPRATRALDADPVPRPRVVRVQRGPVSEKRGTKTQRDEGLLTEPLQGERRNEL